jgi:hypothetical protein
MIRKVMRFWTKEHSLTALLAVLVIQLFILVPTMGTGLVVRLVADLALSAFLLAGLLTMAPGRGFRIFFSVLVVVGAIVHFTRLLFDFRVLAAFDFIFSTFGLIAVLAITLKMVYQEGRITGHRIRGAIAAYLMLAAIFGKVYAMIAYLIPGAFNISPAFTRLSFEGTEDFLYFSVIALTTVGFGDITPVAPIARSFVMVEAFIGQLYPAVLIARLVSLSIVEKEGK